MTNDFPDYQVVTLTSQYFRLAHFVFGHTRNVQHIPTIYTKFIYLLVNYFCSLNFKVKYIYFP